MTVNGWIQILFFFAAILAVTRPLGAFMHRVLEGGDHLLKRPLGWLERLVYRLGGVDWHEQSSRAYAAALLAFSAFTLLVTYAIQRLQQWLPFNPQKMGAVEAGSAFNTAASFTTNTNWQGYVGEATRVIVINVPWYLSAEARRCDDSGSSSGVILRRTCGGGAKGCTAPTRDGCPSVTRVTQTHCLRRHAKRAQRE